MSALKAVLSFLHLSKTSLLSRSSRKKQLKMSKTFCFQTHLLPEYCQWIIRGRETADAFTLWAFSKHSSIQCQSNSSSFDFFLDSFLSMKRYLPLLTIPFIQPKWINKIEEKSVNPQRILQLQIFTVTTLHQDQHSSSCYNKFFWIKCKNNRFTEMISNLLGFQLFCQEILPRK